MDKYDKFFNIACGIALIVVSVALLLAVAGMFISLFTR